MGVIEAFGKLQIFSAAYMGWSHGQNDAQKTMGIIAVVQGQRKIPVQYAQRMAGRKMVQGGSSFMPLKVNYAGVMPIIFAQAILMFPEKLLDMLGKSLDYKLLEELALHFREDQYFHMLAFAAMILFFSYFWVATQFNEVQIADDLKKYGGYIPGVRPGNATSDFLHHTMSRITLAAACGPPVPASTMRSLQ